MAFKRNIVNMSDKTNIKPLFDKTVGYTPDLIKEAAEFTGISIRTLQRYYKGDGFTPSSNNLLKLIAYFSMKFNREVKLNEIINQQENVNNVADLSLAAFRSKKKKSLKK